MPNPEGIGGKSAKIVEGHNDPQQTADRLAKDYGVAPKTIRRDAAFARAVDKIEQTIGQYPSAAAQRVPQNANPG